jgi:hypothetical protein
VDALGRYEEIVAELFEPMSGRPMGEWPAPAEQALALRRG